MIFGVEKLPRMDKLPSTFHEHEMTVFKKHIRIASCIGREDFAERLRWQCHA
jgi:hypothetical protein